MPKKDDIKKFWEQKMISIGKFFCPDDYNAQDACFACGMAGEETERCHIFPKCKGGADTVENLHLLCPECHKQSEMLYEDEYWEWLVEQGLVSKVLFSRAVSRNYQKFLMAFVKLN